MRSDGTYFNPPPGETDNSRAHNIYFANVGTLSTGEKIDMRITNESEYNAFNSAQNGKVDRDDGTFGTINLRTPRASASEWHNHITWVQLRIEFINAATGGPIEVGAGGFRTFVTFFDFDQGKSLPDGTHQVRECLQVVDGSASALCTESQCNTIADPTQIAVLRGDEYYQLFDEDPSYAPYQLPSRVDSPIYCSSERGTKRDNPSSPHILTAVQRARTVMVEVVGQPYLVVRMSIDHCCMTGRNLMFAGYSEAMRPLCPVVSSSLFPFGT